MNVALYLMAVLGFVYVIGQSRISLPFRIMLAGNEASRAFAFRQWLVNLVECPSCASFWVGLLGGPWLLSIEQPLANPLYVAFASVGATFVVGGFLGIVAQYRR